MVDVLEHDQRLGLRLQFAPQAVGARDMGAQAAEPPDLGVEQERNRVGGEPLRPAIDDEAERPAADQRVQGGEIVLAVERRFVHRGLRRAGLERPRRLAPW